LVRRKKALLDARMNYQPTQFASNRRDRVFINLNTISETAFTT